MSNPITGILVSLLRGISKLIPSQVTDGFNSVVDFAYVRFLGLPFIVLGYRQTGKTTLLEWLRKDMITLEEFDPEPTAAGGEPMSTFRAQVGEEGMRVKPKRDVGGEYAMWETDWVDLLRDARPRGIIFLIDGSNPSAHKDALNFTLQMIDEEIVAVKNLKAFLLLANKSDLWGDERTLDELLDDYRNETRRLKHQSQRLGYRTFVYGSSLKTGDGVKEAIATFFNAIRPRARVAAAA
jgi:hypothetical protein